VLDDKRKVRRDMKAHIKRVDRSSDLRICGDCCSVIYELDLLKSKGEKPFDLFILDLNINTIGLRQCNECLAMLEKNLLPPFFYLKGALE